MLPHLDHCFDSGFVLFHAYTSSQNIHNLLMQTVEDTTTMSQNDSVISLS